MKLPATTIAASLRLALLMIAALAATAWAQADRREPRIGYVYPAGARRGTTTEILVGGQFLRGVSDAYVTGTGVHATVIQHYRPLTNIDQEQREALRDKMREMFAKHLDELAETGRDLPPMARELLRPAPRRGDAKPGKKDDADKTKAKPATLPEHPLLRNLESKSLRELQDIRNELMSMKQKRQPNMQIAESAVVKIAIDANAAAGDREIRLLTPAGLTNPLCFQVGTLPEARESEPNDPGADDWLPPPPLLESPVVINGQIKPGDVDRLPFQARKGRKLVIETSARRLIPYLADAVPGWFQATLTLYDTHGEEVAFADDYRFDPDPILFYQVPADGEYTLEIRDAIYRGREDFVYRIAISDQPFITEVFPLGGRAGSRTVAQVEGWNLSSSRLPLGTPPGPTGMREAVLRQKNKLSNPVTYAVGALPECEETEPNDTRATAQAIEPPRIVNGRIAKIGDVDVFAFQGHAGEEVVAEVEARRLSSPLDSLLRLVDASGKVLAFNDDHEDPEMGLLTHHADSYLRAKLPADGSYAIEIVDAQQHGGDAYAYRLRISPPRPDFALRVTPASINVRPVGSTLICVHVVRLDGFDGDIDVVLKDDTSGFALNGGRLPPGRDRVQMTLTAPARPLDQPIALQLEGRARIKGFTISRPVVPAEDMMQAFIYRHLVPFQELMVAAAGPRRGAPPVEIVSEGPVRLPAGGTAQIRVRTGKRPMQREIHFELFEPPRGVTLEKVTPTPDGVTFAVKADGDTAKVGLADNLIVEAFTEVEGQRPGGKAKQKQRMSLGVLPAIPFEVVQR